MNSMCITNFVAFRDQTKANAIILIVIVCRSFRSLQAPVSRCLGSLAVLIDMVCLVHVFHCSSRGSCGYWRLARLIRCTRVVWRTIRPMRLFACSVVGKSLLVSCCSVRLGFCGREAYRATVGHVMRSVWVMVSPNSEQFRGIQFIKRPSSRTSFVNSVAYIVLARTHDFSCLADIVCNRLAFKSDKH